MNPPAFPLRPAGRAGAVRPARTAAMALLLTSALAALPVLAQSVPPPSAASTTSATSPKSDDAVQLTPFEVSSEKDTGFAAASALAGGRLASDLRDTPAAYSV